MTVSLPPGDVALESDAPLQVIIKRSEFDSFLRRWAPAEEKFYPANWGSPIQVQVPAGRPFAMAAYCLDRGYVEMLHPGPGATTLTGEPATTSVELELPRHSAPGKIALSCDFKNTKWELNSANVSLSLPITGIPIATSYDTRRVDAEFSVAPGKYLLEVSPYATIMCGNTPPVLDWARTERRSIEIAPSSSLTLEHCLELGGSFNACF